MGEEAIVCSDRLWRVVLWCRYMAYMKEQEDKAGTGASDVADPKEMRAVRGHKTARRKKGARPAPESV